jgi:hypothetical protein
MRDFNLIENIYKFHGMEIFNEDPFRKRKIYLIHTYKSKVEIWALCGLLDLEVMCKRPPKKKDYYLIFTNFMVKK